MNIDLQTLKRGDCFKDRKGQQFFLKILRRFSTTPIPDLFDIVKLEPGEIKLLTFDINSLKQHFDYWQYEPCSAEEFNRGIDNLMKKIQST
jgi:hypothetical protein